jgi:beta-phosphoglucomutase
MIAAVVFDFDGVIVDSEPLHLSAYQEVLSSLGGPLPREEYYARYLGYDDQGVFRAVAEARGWQLDDGRIEELIAEKSRVFQGMLGEDVLYPGARSCIERLAAVWPLGIASGALRHEIEAILRRTGLAPHFRFIVAAGDTTASKPAPDPYRRAAELHGVAPEACVAVEDSRWGIDSAKTAGLPCVAITNTYPVAELMTADIIITSLKELTPDLVRTLG